MNQRLMGIGMTSQRTRLRLIQRLREKGISSETVLDAMCHVPRHIFVDEALASRAYEDTALPIGLGQTISQPFIVARMTEILMQTDSVKKVLEIGTGSGYQTAILASLVEQVYTIERIQSLQSKARQRLRELKLKNVRFKFDDGIMGWPEQAEYDVIIVTAAPTNIPSDLLAQVKMGGRLIIPAGEDGQQTLHLLEKTEEGVTQHQLDAVQFVPLLGGTV